MDSSIVSYVLQYAGILTEIALFFYLAWSSRWKWQGGVSFYLISLLVVELTRAYVLHAYGYASRQFSYAYWTTDFLLVMSLFVLVCLFFRRACLHQEKLWRFVRLLLFFVLVMLVGISGVSFLRNYRHLPYIIVGFNQNLYFTCLVLNTLLYLLLQQIESTDDQLGLLVCGVGIQFAGPAATFALLHLTAVEHFAESLNSLVMRLCTFGMLLVWGYAVVHVKDKATVVTRREIPVLAEVTANLNI
jgi:hypothetical protein